MRGIFKAEETHDGKYMVSFNNDLHEEVMKRVPFEKRNSFNVLYARIMGLSYAEYLRYVRDKYGATIRGKGHKFPIAVWDNATDCNLVCKELLLRWTKL